MGPASSVGRACSSYHVDRIRARSSVRARRWSSLSFFGPAFVLHSLMTFSTKWSTPLHDHYLSYSTYSLGSGSSQIGH